MNIFNVLYEDLQSQGTDIKYWETQRNNTQKSYELQAAQFNKVFNKGDIVIDYGSGLGMVRNAFTNFTYIDFEPYPQKRESPDFTDSEQLVKKYAGKASGVVCNLVLNVIDDIKEREKVIRNILTLLKVGGIAYIVTRTPEQVESAKTKEPYKDGYLMKSKSGKTFQKGFSRSELSSFVQNIANSNNGKFTIGSGVGVGGNSAVKIVKDK